MWIFRHRWCYWLQVKVWTLKKGKKAPCLFETQLTCCRLSNVRRLVSSNLNSSQTGSLSSSSVTVVFDPACLTFSLSINKRIPFEIHCHYQVILILITAIPIQTDLLTQVSFYSTENRITVVPHIARSTSRECKPVQKFDSILLSKLAKRKLWRQWLDFSPQELHKKKKKLQEQNGIKAEYTNDSRLEKADIGTFAIRVSGHLRRDALQPVA